MEYLINWIWGNKRLWCSPVAAFQFMFCVWRLFKMCREEGRHKYIYKLSYETPTKAFTVIHRWYEMLWERLSPKNPVNIINNLLGQWEQKITLQIRCRLIHLRISLNIVRFCCKNNSNITQKTTNKKSHTKKRGIQQSAKKAVSITGDLQQHTNVRYMSGITEVQGSWWTRWPQMILQGPLQPSFPGFYNSKLCEEKFHI